jgi:hypothetical protein
MSQRQEFNMEVKQEPVDEAIAAFREPDNHLNRREMATTYGVAYSTFKHRLNGRPDHQKAAETLQKLLPDEEDTLVKVILHHLSRGFSPSLPMLRDWAETILKSRLGDNAPGVGVHWTKRFLKRHDEIASAWSQRLAADRVTAVTKDRLVRHFDLFESTIAQYGILPEDIINMDEKGVSMGHADRAKVLVRRSKREIDKMVGHAGNRDWVTLIEAFSAGGEVLPPLIIFKGKLIQPGWVDLSPGPGLPADTILAVSDNGWTTNEIGLKWLKMVLWKWVEKRRKGAYTLLIVDGHESHVSWEFVSFCSSNNIILMCLPAHTTHILQPADVGLFSPLQTFYGQYVDRISRYQHAYIDKSCFLGGYIEARKKAYTRENILSAFATAGLVPLDPEHAYKRLPPPEPDDSSDRSVTPEPPCDPSQPRTPHARRQIDGHIDIIFSHNHMSPTSVRLVSQIAKCAKGNATEHVVLQKEHEHLLAANAHKKKRDRRINTTEAQILTKDAVMGELLVAQRQDADKKRKARWLALKKKRLRELQAQGIDTDRKRPRKGRLVILPAALMKQKDVETDDPTTADELSDSDSGGDIMDM